MKGKSYSLKTELEKVFSSGILGKIERSRAVLALGIKMDDITPDMDNPSLEGKISSFMNELKNQNK